jgi:hypothetical protein
MQCLGKSCRQNLKTVETDRLTVPDGFEFAGKNPQQYLLGFIFERRKVRGKPVRLTDRRKAGANRTGALCERGFGPRCPPP